MKNTEAFCFLSYFLLQVSLPVSSATTCPNGVTNHFAPVIIDSDTMVHLTVTVNISGSAPVDFTIFNVIAHDADNVAPSNEITYNIIGEGKAANVFYIKPDGEVRLSTSLNSDPTTSYKILVTVEDKGCPAKTSTATATINVLITHSAVQSTRGGSNCPNGIPNHFSPVIMESDDMMQSTVTVNISDTAPVDFLIFTVFAYDADKTAPSNQMTYNIIGEGNAGSVFYIKPDGQVLLRSSLSSDPTDSYRILVTVEDKGCPPKTSTTTATIIALITHSSGISHYWEQKLQALQQIVESLQSQMTPLTLAAKTAEDKAADLEQRARSLELKVTELAEKSSAAEQKATTMEEKASTMEQRANALQLRVNGMRCENGILEWYNFPYSASYWPKATGVNFSRPFADIPKLSYGLILLNSAVDDDTRVEIFHSDLTINGFTLTGRNWQSYELYWIKKTAVVSTMEKMGLIVLLTLQVAELSVSRGQPGKQPDDKPPDVRPLLVAYKELEKKTSDQQTDLLALRVDFEELMLQFKTRRCESGIVDWVTCPYNQSHRPQNTFVKFQETFKVIPAISYGITTLDIDSSANTHVRVSDSDRAPTGFTLTGDGWRNSAVCRVKVSWMACSP